MARRDPAFTVEHCTTRKAYHATVAREYFDRSVHFRELGDLRRAAWEQEAAASQYRIAREYLDCVFVMSGQSRIEPKPLVA